MSRLVFVFMVLLLLGGRTFAATVSLVSPVPTNLVGTISSGVSGDPDTFAKWSTGIGGNPFGGTSSPNGSPVNEFKAYEVSGAYTSGNSVSFPFNGTGGPLPNQTLLSFASEGISTNTSTPFTLWTGGRFTFSVDSNISVNITSSVANPTDSDNYARLLYGGTPLSGFVNLAANTIYTVEVGSKTTLLSYEYNVAGTLRTNNELLVTYLGPAGGGAVPEPASLAVFGVLGLGGFAARRFRKK